MRYWVLAIVVSIFASAVASQVNADRKPAAGYIVTANSGVQYMNGGIGDDSRREVNQIAHERNFNVKLVFAWRTGNFVSDIPVIIDDAEGNKVLALERSDPLLLLRLPPGHYTARAEYNGATVSHAFKAPETGMKVVPFVWQKPDDSEGLAPRE